MGKGIGLLAFLAFGLVAAHVQAQPKPQREGGFREVKAFKEGPEVLSGDYLKRLEKGLKLDEGQRKEIGALLEKDQPGLKKKFEEIRAEEKKLRVLQEEMGKSMRALHERIREKLSDEQKERFDMMRVSPRMGGSQREGDGMRGEDSEPGELSPEVREKMEKRKAKDFPPEKWERPQDLEKGEGLPPEIREHIEKRLRNRGPGERQQRDLPPPEKWNDRMSPAEGE